MLLLRARAGESVLERRAIWEFGAGEYNRWWAGGICPGAIGRVHLCEDAPRYPIYEACFYDQMSRLTMDAGVPEEMLVLMADIFPTGYFAAARFLKNLPARDREEYTTAVIGCGPVGLCTIACALTMVKTVYAIDRVPERLAEAEKLGAIPIHLNDSPVEKIKAATDGRGADVVMEVVGHADAFMLAFDMIRPWGQISSIGVHTEQIPLNGILCYGKNVTMIFGRCPVRSVFDEALVQFQKLHPKLAFLTGEIMSLEDAPQAYKDFEANKVHKVVFKLPSP